MPNYQNGKIYKIVSETAGLVYIGSTIQTLRVRLWWHESDKRKYERGNKNYMTSFEVLKHPDYKIVLIENYPCNSRKELQRREGEVELLYENRVNKMVAGRTPVEYAKMYREERPEQLKANKNKYYQENKQKIIEKTNKYQREHKEQSNAHKKKYAENNPEKCKESKRRYQEKNKDEINARKREKRKNMDPEAKALLNAKEREAYRAKHPDAKHRV